MVDPLESILAEVASLPASASRPAITLTYAQTLDGCIATADRGTLRISSPASLVLTHRLRAQHDALLIGVGTVLADNPRLTVRLVKGPDPRPVVLDTTARTPPGSQLLRGPQSPWILCAPDAPPDRRRRLEASGARLLETPRAADGRLDLAAALARLRSEGVQRLMVEGGANVIASFLHSRAMDAILLTIAARWESGLPALQADAFKLELERPVWLPLDSDGIVFGRLGGGGA
ncbi:MAG: 5-amino-6-(5-phosphoribosylamino)uracil reductase [Chloroflexi bacterium]|nr:5-amino-6-(5-phosphoribosylamino)uracil reductase [Chloroflexota bacterium]